MTPQTLGKYAFWLGIVLAIVVALVPEINEGVVWAMIVIGLIGGYLRVSEKSEIHFFLLALALNATKESLFFLPTIGEFLTDILSGVSIFLGAAVIAVVFRNIIGWFR